LSCLSGDGGEGGLGWGGTVEQLSDDDKSTIKWIIDQLSCVQAARSLLKTLNLSSSSSWTETFKASMHFPCTVDAKNYIAAESIPSIKKLVMPVTWQSMGETLPASHKIAVNLELCKSRSTMFGGSGFLQGSSDLPSSTSPSRPSSSFLGGTSGGSKSIPSEVLKEARAKWALEDSEAENDASGGNTALEDKATKRSQRFMSFVDAWRKSNSTKAAQRAIKASMLIIDWVKALTKARVLLQTVYENSDEIGEKKVGLKVGDRSPPTDPLLVLQAFDQAVLDEHKAATMCTNVEQIANKIDEAEQNVGLSFMRLRCMDMVSFSDWQDFIGKTSRISLWMETIQAIWDDKELDCKSEDCLRKLQNINLVEFSTRYAASPELKSNVTQKYLKLPKSAISNSEGDVAESLYFLLSSLTRCDENVAVKIATQLEERKSGKPGNPLVPAIEVLGKPLNSGGDGNLNLLSSMLSSHLFDILAPDTDGRTPIYVAAVTGNVRALHLLASAASVATEADSKAILKGDKAGHRPEDKCGLLMSVLFEAPPFSKLPRNIASGTNMTVFSKRPGLAQDDFNAVMHSLLDAGADDFTFGDVNAVDLAAQKGYFGICTRIVMAGGESCVMSEGGEFGETALHCVCRAGEKHLVKLILDQVREGSGSEGVRRVLALGHLDGKGGKDDREKGKEEEEKLDHMSQKLRARLQQKRKKKEDKKVVETSKWCAHFAAEKGNLDVLQLLMEEDKDLFKTGGGFDEGLATLAFEAIWSGGGNFCMEKLMEAKGLDLGLLVGHNRKLKRRCGILETAIYANEVGLVRKFFKWNRGALGEDNVVVNGEIIIACMKKGLERMSLCLVDFLKKRDGEAAFDVSAIVLGEEEESLLHLAARTNQLNLATRLVAGGVDVKTGDKGGWQAIHYSIAAGHGSMTQMLGGRDKEIEKAVLLICQKMRYFAIIKRKIRAAGGEKGGAKRVKVSVRGAKR